MGASEFIEVKLGELFASRRERGKNGLPTLSVMIDGGLQDRDSLDRKMDTNLTAEEHLLVRKGDIAYNMMRMWQGANGLASADAIVSPAYVVLEPKNGIDPLFAAYFFKAARTIYLFRAYSHGLTKDRLRLYYDDFARIPVRIPSLGEQKRIAEILSTWDGAIIILDKLIQNSKNQKMALMRLLIREHPSSWCAASFDELFEVSNNKRTQIKKDDYKMTGSIPIVDQGVTFIAGYTDSTAIYSDVPVIVFGDHTKIVKFVDFPFCPGADGTQILKTSDKVTPLFGYYLLSDLRLPDLGYSRNMRELKSATFAYPTNHDQQRSISNIIAAADRTMENLKTQREMLLQQKTALLYQLTTGKCRVNSEELAA